MLEELLWDPLPSARLSPIAGTQRSPGGALATPALWLHPTTGGPHPPPSPWAAAPQEPTAVTSALPTPAGWNKPYSCCWQQRWLGKSFSGSKPPSWEADGLAWFSPVLPGAQCVPMSLCSSPQQLCACCSALLSCTPGLVAKVLVRGAPWNVLSMQSLALLGYERDWHSGEQACSREAEFQSAVGKPQALGCCRESTPGVLMPAPQAQV